MARARGVPGAHAILSGIANGPDRVRRGLRPDGRAPIREDIEIFDSVEGGTAVGRVGLRRG